MKSSFLHKTILAAVFAVSLFSFVFINTRTGLATSAQDQAAPLVEQALEQADDEQDGGEMHLPDVAILGTLLRLAGKFFLVVG